MKRSLSTAALLSAAALALPACESMQLPEGYAWNFSTQEQNDIKEPRGSYRWGFDQRRINESAPATWRDGGRYDFASALPKPYAADPLAPAVSRAQPGDPFLDADLTDAARPITYGDNEPVFAASPQPIRTPAPTVAQGAFRAPTEIRILTSPADSPAAVTPTQPAAHAGPRTHTIKKGDNYWDLAKQYYGQGIRFTDIQKANPGKDPKKLQVGDTIVIPQ